MTLTVYTLPDGPYVLVHDFIRAIRKAEAQRGPLTHCERDRKSVV